MLTAAALLCSGGRVVSYRAMDWSKRRHCALLGSISERRFDNRTRVARVRRGATRFPRSSRNATRRSIAGRIHPARCVLRDRQRCPVADLFRSHVHLPRSLVPRRPTADRSRNRDRVVDRRRISYEAEQFAAHFCRHNGYCILVLLASSIPEIAGRNTCADRSRLLRCYIHRSMDDLDKIQFRGFHGGRLESTTTRLDCETVFRLVVASNFHFPWVLDVPFRIDRQFLARRIDVARSHDRFERNGSVLPDFLGWLFSCCGSFAIAKPK